MPYRRDVLKGLGAAGVAALTGGLGGCVESATDAEAVKDGVYTGQVTALGEMEHGPGLPGASFPAEEMDVYHAADYDAPATMPANLYLADPDDLLADEALVPGETSETSFEITLGDVDADRYASHDELRDHPALDTGSDNSPMAYFYMAEIDEVLER